MRNCFALFIGLSVASCAATGGPKVDSAPVERPGLATRELSQSEKIALAHALSRTLKDPASAHFQWVPLRYAVGAPTTEYCGLVNGKNSYGGYNGFEMFHAVLTADAKGQFTSGEIDDIIANNPIGTDQLKENVHFEELCIQAGYGNVSTVPR